MVSLYFKKEVTEKPDKLVQSHTALLGVSVELNLILSALKFDLFFPSAPLSLILIAFEKYVCEKEASMK